MLNTTTRLHSAKQDCTKVYRQMSLFCFKEITLVPQYHLGQTPQADYSHLPYWALSLLWSTSVSNVICISPAATHVTLLLCSASTSAYCKSRIQLTNLVPVTLIQALHSSEQSSPSSPEMPTQAKHPVHLPHDPTKNLSLQTILF